MTDDSPTVRIIKQISMERARQSFLRDSGKFTHTVADDGMTDGYRLAVLMEEVGEVANALQMAEGECKAAAMHNELIQVAAVAVAWCEYLEGLTLREIPIVR